MIKKTRKPNPGLAAEQMAAFPLHLGHVDFIPQRLTFVPVGTLGGVKFARIKNERWANIEAGIGVALDVNQRGLLNIVCSTFIYTCVLKPHIPSFNRHLLELEKKANEILNIVEEIILFLSFPEYPKGPSPNRTISTASDHFKFRGMSKWKSSLSALTRLRSEVMMEKKLIGKQKTKTKGADGHYELRPLLSNLVYLARSTGDDLRITSHEYRAETGSEVNTRTPLVLFVEQVLAVIRLDMDEWLKKYELTNSQANDARMLIHKVLNKRTGNLLKPLQSVRLEIEGKPRTKIKQKKVCH